MCPFETHKSQEEDRLSEPIYPPCRFSHYGNVLVLVLTDLSPDVEAFPLWQATFTDGEQQ